MTQQQKLIFDELGGEPLDGSGFEEEQSEPDFHDTYEFDTTADGRS